MKKYIRSKIATSLILSQLISRNMCFAGNNTSKTWQEKSVEKLQSFAREIKSSIKADPVWWLAGGTIGLAALVASPFVVNHFRQIPKNFKQEFESIKNYHDLSKKSSAVDLDKILTFKKLDKTVKAVCKDYETNGIQLPSIADINVRLYYDFCVCDDYNLPELLNITTEFLQNSERKIIFIGGIYPKYGAKLENLLSVYLMCLLRLNFPDRVFLVSHKSNTERAGIASAKSTEDVENIMAQFNSVFATAENLNAILLGTTPKLEYLPDENFMTNMNGQEITKKQTYENEFKKLYNNLGDSSYIPAQSLKNAIDTASTLMNPEKIIVELSGNQNNTVFVASDIHGDYSCLKFVIDKFLSSENSKLVFLGDYIHRGKSNLQVLYLLCMLKKCYPKRVYLLRGNHEERNNSIHEQFSFDAALDSIYSATSGLKDSLDTFSKSMPLAAIVNNKFYCVHGGINPNIPLSTLRQLDKDLLWYQGDITTEISDRKGKWHIPYSNKFAIYSALWGSPAGELYYRDGGNGNRPNYSRTCVNTFLNAASLKCLVHGHNHENKVDFTDQSSVSVRTNPLNWYGKERNESVGLVEIKNNHLTLQEYTYPNLETLKSKIVDKSY